MPADPVPSPRSGGDDDEAALLPQQRTPAGEPDEPVAHDAVAEDDVADDPVAEDDVADDPVAEDVVADDVVADDATDQAADDPVAVVPAPEDSAAGALASPRPAPDDHPDLLHGIVPPEPEPTSGPRVYADGSALAQYVDGSSSHTDWVVWAQDHEDELVTTPLGLTELRRFAAPAGVEARGVARDVEGRVTVVRFSDQTLRAATKVSGVLPPFTALHIGAALAHPGVVAVATYEVQLARVAALHGFQVVSPGMAPFWWESDD
jgi:hypothetical protein